MTRRGWSRPASTPIICWAALEGVEMLTIIDKLTRALALYCGGTVLILMLGLIVVDVTCRYALNTPVFGALDLYGVLLALVVACCIAYGGRTGAHVSADVFAQLVGPRVERIIATFIKLLAAIVMAVWSWQLFGSGRMSTRLGETTQLLNIPFELIYQALSFGIGLYAIVLMLEAALIALRGGVPLLIDESRTIGSPE